jgi:hypothetical protein
MIKLTEGLCGSEAPLYTKSDCLTRDLFQHFIADEAYKYRGLITSRPICLTLGLTYEAVPIFSLLHKPVNLFRILNRITPM